MLQEAVDWFTYSALGLSRGAHLASSLNFFIYDSITILLLLSVVTFFMSLLRYYLPVEKLRDFLAKRKWYGLDYVLAAFFGAVTPFCSCSSIPLFIGFVGAGIPLGVTFSFLITSPLINEVAVVLFIALFGWKVTALYVAAGMLIGVVGGYIIGRLKMERYVESYIMTAKIHATSEKTRWIISWSVVQEVTREAWDITKKVVPYVLLGVGIGALIHGYVPEKFFEQYVSGDNLLAVPIAVLVGVPLYASAHSVLPIIQSLVDKGVPLGTALAFMMAMVGLSFPEALILKKAIKLPLLLTFFGIVTVGIIAIGYTFNLIL
jgi:uncharacterized membrane protein YraQ (UPF0718 family)